MAKLEYATPMMSEEVFAADEYVAACWGVSCSRGAGPKEVNYVEDARRGITHGKLATGTGCGYENHQYIKVDKNGNVTMDEIDTDGLGTLKCTIKGTNWIGNITLNVKNLHQGDTIYWTTSSGDRTWHHLGTVNMSGNSTNHS